MNNNLETARDKFIEGISRMGDAFGLNRFVIQLYALLYLTGKPLSLDEIAEALGASKGNVSINIRELERWGAVRNVWIKGSRRDYYEAGPDVKKVFLNKFKSAVEKRLTEVSNLTAEFNEIVQSNSENLTEEEKSIVKVYKERSKKIEELNALASNALKIAGKLL